MVIPCLCVLLACVGGKSSGDSGAGTPDSGSPGDGGSADGGSADGGSADGGSDGGSGDGGLSDSLCDLGAAASIDDLPFDSLQDALESSVDGDTVRVCPGEHRVAWELDEGARTLIGEGGDADAVILLPAEKDRSILEVENARLLLRELSLAEGRAPRGAAVRVEGGELELDGCVLRDNQSKSSGGAIYLASDGKLPPALTADGSRFLRNHSDFAGGAIYAIVRDGVDADVVLTDSSFQDNSAATYGGAATVATNPGSISLQVVDSVFTDNISGGEGGGLYLTGGVATQLTRVELVGNQAEDGGGIRVFAGSGDAAAVTMDQVHFESNQALEAGGAIQLYGDDLPLTVSGSTFVDNRADRGGAFYLSSFAEGSAIHDAVFSGNQAEDGAALHTSAGLSLHDSTFSGDRGEAIVQVSGSISAGVIDVDLQGLAFSKVEGGAVQVFVRDGGTATLSDIHCDGCSNTDDGGGVFVGVYHEPASLSLSGLSLTDCSSGDDGGALTLDINAPTTATVSASVLSGGTAEGSGGALYARVDDGVDFDLTLEDLEITSNQARDAAVLLDGGVNLHGSGLNFGTGSDANVPADLGTDREILEGLGSDVSLRCEPGELCVIEGG